MPNKVKEAKYMHHKLAGKHRKISESVDGIKDPFGRIQTV
jgi:hypothetical protein